MIHSSYLAELDQRGGYLNHPHFPFPLICIKQENYSGVPVQDHFGRDTGWKILRGSLLSRQLRGGDRARVYEYEYIFAQWLGRRFARRIKKGGPRVVVIKTKKSTCVFRPTNQVADCFIHSFRYGFSKEYVGSDASYKEYKESGCLEENAIYIAQSGFYEQNRSGASELKVGDLYLAFLGGLDEEKRRSARALLCHVENCDRMRITP